MEKFPVPAEKERKMEALAFSCPTHGTSDIIIGPRHRFESSRVCYPSKGDVSYLHIKSSMASLYGLKFFDSNLAVRAIAKTASLSSELLIPYLFAFLKTEFRRVVTRNSIANKAIFDPLL